MRASPKSSFISLPFKTVLDHHNDTKLLDSFKKILVSIVLIISGIWKLPGRWFGDAKSSNFELHSCYLADARRSRPKPIFMPAILGYRRKRTVLSLEMARLCYIESKASSSDRQNIQQ